VERRSRVVTAESISRSSDTSPNHCPVQPRPWTSAVVWKFVDESALEAAADLVGLDAATGGDELPAAFDTGLDVDDLQQHTHTTV